MNTMILAERIELLENTLDADKKTVQVVLIRPGWSQNGRFYSPTVLTQAAPLFEGVKAYANHPTREQLRKGEGRSVLDITGDYTDVHIGEGGELRATRHVYGKAGEAVWPLIERSVETKRPVIGVSINALGQAGTGTAPDGKEGIIVESIDIANSADDVDAPAAGGEFETILMGNDTLVHDLLQTITQHDLTAARPDLIDAMRKQVKRSRQTEAVRALTEQRNQARRDLVETMKQMERLRSELDSYRTENQTLELAVTLEKELRKAHLPEEWESDIRAQLEKTSPEKWPAIFQRERRKAKALGGQVTVTGAPRQQQAAVEAAPSPSDRLPRADENVEDWAKRVEAMHRGK